VLSHWHVGRQPRSDDFRRLVVGRFVVGQLRRLVVVGGLARLVWRCRSARIVGAF
jgi:hypothetical protein